ncbi:fasciclin domain-containing protein [Aurantiacibacter rhizosphaerae]|uniref:FAS1 domain-containing protein n=1 Tax=Aurantiacibacter rhizosphaerae TaxID=2691582 RepID=A0A844XCL6_9SPHN|nr:fasciclin domain-containing protein [Aurantiacibacter rhizosphaerae]MWV27358.1 hypothetical protein [Aurantiacibacter rhizosphaerae]
MQHNHTLTAIIAAAGLVSLSACNSDADVAEDGTQEVRSDTLAALLEDADNLSVISGILGNAGLQAIFDGTASYTIFAPTDDAFAELDLPMDGEEAGAARVAIVREHIVPGYLSRADIEAAIGQSGGSVEMQTMGSNTLTFSNEGENLVVTSSDGSKAIVTGDVISGANGSLFPVDTVLKSMGDPQ